VAPPTEFSSGRISAPSWRSTCLGSGGAIMQDWLGCLLFSLDLSIPW
jgi:hypothetical protein